MVCVRRFFVPFFSPLALVIRLIALPCIRLIALPFVWHLLPSLSTPPHPSLTPSILLPPFFLLLHIPSIQCKQSLAAVQNARLDTSCGVLEEGGTIRGGGEGESEGGAGAGAGGGEEECEEETKRNGKGLFGGRKR